MNTLYSRLTYASQPFPFNQLKRMTATSGFDRGHTLSVFHHLTTVLQAIQSSLVIGCSYDIYFAIAAVFLLTTAIPTAINYLSLMQHITSHSFSTCVIRKALLHWGRINNLISLLLVYKHELHNQHNTSQLIARTTTLPPSKLMLHQVRTLKDILQSSS